MCVNILKIPWNHSKYIKTTSGCQNHSSRPYRVFRIYTNDWLCCTLLLINIHIWLYCDSPAFIIQKPVWCRDFLCRQSSWGKCRCFLHTVPPTIPHWLEERGIERVRVNQQHGLMRSLKTCAVLGKPKLTFAEDVNGVSFTELQVLWALSIVVIERHHLVQDGTVGKGVFGLRRR